MTRRRAWVSCLALLLILTRAHDAQAQIGAAGYFTGGLVMLAASDSFDAVAGSTRTLSLGGGGTVTGLWRNLFADVAVTRQTLDGERVFVSNGSVFKLGIPWEASFTPIDLAGGWRFATSGVTPFVGVGVTLLKYTERSDFAQSGDDLDERKAGLLVLAGVDVPFGRWLRVGGELRYRRVTGVLGEAGASKVFGEDDLGGISTAVRVSVGR